jgi:hypothetical protein
MQVPRREIQTSHRLGVLGSPCHSQDCKMHTQLSWVMLTGQL